MTKHVLFILIILLVGVQAVRGQMNSEPENPFKGMTLAEAKDKLETELFNVKMLIEVGNTFSIDRETESETDSVEADIDAIEPYLIYEPNAIRDSLNNFFSRISFDQNLGEPYSQIKLNSSSEGIARLVDNKHVYDLYRPVYTAKRIYYADGEVSDTDEEFDLQIANKKKIDSISVAISYTYPLHTNKIKLSLSNPDFILDEDNSIHLKSLDGRNARLVTTSALNSKICVLYARTAVGNKLTYPTSTYWRGSSNDAIDKYIKDVEIGLTKIINNLKDDKYENIEALNKSYWEISPKEPEGINRDTTTEITLRYEYKIRSIEITYVDSFGEYKEQKTFSYESLKNTGDDNYSVASNDKGLLGVVDRSGNWVVEPAYTDLISKGGIFFDGNPLDDAKGWVPFRLNINKKQLEKCKYWVRDIWKSGLLHIVDLKNGNQEGVINNQGEEIIPMEKQTITYENEVEKLIVRKMEKKQSHYRLYDVDGKQVLEGPYLFIFVRDGFICVKTFQNPDKIIIYNKELKQISKSDWADVLDYRHDVGLFFVKDINDGLFCADQNGDVAIKSDQYSLISDSYFKNGYCQVRKLDKNDKYKYGFINPRGEIVIPLEYDSVNDFWAKYTCVSKDGKDMLIDKQNNIQLEFPSPVASSSIYENGDAQKFRYTLKNGFVYDGNGKFIEDTSSLNDER